ncbi:uncharacterized protein LOC141640718 [Silene latifolia]|uniref:uncharacterized protein LOC141640718 n=1 Tax=Silene latifolia TaxID=37657 RepID=UPI003D789EDF
MYIVDGQRVEGAHAALKRLLRTFVGGLDTVFETIHHAVNLQYHKIKDEFARSQTIRLHLTQAMSVYQRLTHNVTHNAIRILDDALKEVKCNNCALKTTHGLPCACEIIDLVNTGKCIELNSVHQFWRIFCTATEDKNNGKDNYTREHQEQNRLRRLADDVISSGKVEMMRKISEFAEILLHPPNVVDPEVKKTKGRPKKTSVSRNPSHWEYVDKMFPKTSRKKAKTMATIDTPTSSTTPVNTPITSRARVNTPTTSMSFSQDDKSCTPFPYPNAIADYFSRYITDCVNVKGYGHCGYRAIAHEIYGNENEWAKVRHDLLDELNVNRQYYVDVCGVEREIAKFIKMISFWEPFALSEDYCLGHCTNGPKKIITTVLVASAKHFVWVRLRNDSPLPSLYPSCRGIEHDSSQVANRITLYESMQPPR